MRHSRTDEVLQERLEHRVMGIETEYGITVPGHPHVNSMLASNQVVSAYASTMRIAGRTTKWDFDDEAPLRDARGFDMSRAEADPSQLTDEELGLANVILTNGARLYVDHAHPEYSSPEVLRAYDALVYDRAGEEIMSRAAALASAAPGVQQIQLYKNNTDNKGASYGTHENYLMSRLTPFPAIVGALIPFFVSRQVFTGSGRVGIGQDGKSAGFQLSQRADFFEVEVGLETTLKRPIINTRDEPHADPEVYRRLHVIVGDANLAEVSTWLKLGTTALVIDALEAGALQDSVAAELMPAKPIREMHAVSHDPTLQHKVELADGRQMTAVEMQLAFAEAVQAHLERVGELDRGENRALMERWVSVLDSLQRDPKELVGVLDWPAKLHILEGYRRRDGLQWHDPRLQLVDLQWSDMRPGRGLARKLEASGRLERLTSETEIARAISHPPEGTRAYFRGECLRRYAESISAASWDSVIFDVPSAASLQRVPTLDPLRGTKDHVLGLLDRCPTAEDLLRMLSG